MKGKMTSGSPWRLILVFSLPILLSGLLQQCYNIADTMIVGRFLKLEALTGMGATWALNYIIIAFCQGAGMGIGIPVSQQYGAGRDKELRRLYQTAISSLCLHFCTFPLWL